MPNGTQTLECRASGCAAGILIAGNLRGAPDTEALNRVKSELETDIRANLSGMTRKELSGLHPTDAYVAYYKKFGYTYHVLAQLESIIQGKAIPAVIPPVTAMFMAELKNTLLTAAYDLDQVTLPLYLDIADGREEYTLLNGKMAAVVSGDYILRDSEGPFSSILRGPARRASITAETRNALYFVYAPVGIATDLVAAHLDDIEAYISIIFKDSETLAKETFAG